VATDQQPAITRLEYLDLYVLIIMGNEIDVFQEGELEESFWKAHGIIHAISLRQ
jgi:hypothetical protein